MKKIYISPKIIAGVIKYDTLLCGSVGMDDTPADENYEGGGDAKQGGWGWSNDD